jgi:hypothetical protein
MDFPKLQTGQHAVITAEVSTGIVLRLDGQRRQGNDGEAWRVFDSLSAAREFAVAEVAKNPAVEFGIYDEKQQSVQVVRLE